MGTNEFHVYNSVTVFGTLDEEQTKDILCAWLINLEKQENIIINTDHYISTRSFDNIVEKLKIACLVKLA